jgi:hypothetical protein
MIVGVIRLRTECQFNGWRGQTKGRKHCGALPRLRGRRGRQFACEDLVRGKYFYESRTRVCALYHGVRLHYSIERSKEEAVPTASASQARQRSTVGRFAALRFSDFVA